MNAALALLAVFGAFTLLFWAGVIWVGFRFYLHARRDGLFRPPVVVETKPSSEPLPPVLVALDWNPEERP